MTIPAKYSWLANVGQLPRVIAIGLSLYGLQEIVGKGSNKTIIAWRDGLNVAAGIDPNAAAIKGYSDDDIPWCGLFTAHVAFTANKKVVESPLWARNWAGFGEAVAYNAGTTAKPRLVFEDGKKASLGDVLTFVRQGGGHVGFYIGEDATCYHVLGGNQGNRVSIIRIEKARCIAIRRPVYNAAPASVKPYHLAASGAVSRNEA